jgi:hypothetical protein
MLLNKAILTDPSAALTCLAELLQASTILVSVSQYSTQNGIVEVLDTVAGAIGHTESFLADSDSLNPLDQLDHLCAFFLDAIAQSPQGKRLSDVEQRY